jgi:hypothetical protein
MRTVGTEYLQPLVTGQDQVKSLRSLEPSQSGIVAVGRCRFSQGKSWNGSLSIWGSGSA